jgi:hypothetical protein
MSLSSSSYTCAQTNFTIQFSLSSSSHSVENLSSSCLFSQYSDNNNNSCRSSQTPCFDYQTFDQIHYCAPAFVCSILESCDSYTESCSPNTSVGVVSSCCFSKVKCLPLKNELVYVHHQVRDFLRRTLL